MNELNKIANNGHLCYKKFILQHIKVSSSRFRSKIGIKSKTNKFTTDNFFFFFFFFFSPGLDYTL